MGYDGYEKDTIMGVCLCGDRITKLDYKHHLNCPKLREELKTRFINFTKKYNREINQLVKIGSPWNKLQKIVLYKMKKDNPDISSLMRPSMAKNYLNDTIRKSGLYEECEDERWQRRGSISAASLKRNYGENVDNPGQLKSHIKKLKNSDTTKINPFSSEEFGLLEFIKGKRVLNKDKKDYNTYKRKVKRETNRSKKKMDPPKVCYYTNMKITNDLKYDYNMFNYASIDHKISVLYGFLNDMPPTEIGSIDNIVWCSKFINSIKCEMNEKEFLKSDSMKRYVMISDDIDKLIEGKL